MSARNLFFLTLLLSLGVSSTGASQDPSLFAPVALRNIGPVNMGGRMTDIEGVPGNPDILYFGTASSGLWKTTNGAITTRPIFDDQPVSSIGDLALDPSNPEVLWVGTGEDNLRNTVSFGNGVYRSTDGGESWQHMGLEDTRHISRVLVHPRNPAVVYVAALGHGFGPNEMRGVFRTVDGGESWEKVLYVDEETGASDLEIDPANPNILYAGMWTFLRKPWTMTSGSRKGGVFRSVDGGSSWKKLTNGLPELVGRIGVKVAPSNPRVVYAIMEAKEGTLYRSEDRGESWKRVYDKWDIVSRGFYFAEMRVDPTNENRVYAISGSLRVSNDGGRSFRRIANSIHGDHHTLWIDPKKPSTMANGNDGGIGISRDFGESWRYVQSFPLAQVYQLFLTDEVPFYRVYVGLQDNGSWGGPVRSRNSLGIPRDEWYRIGPGDGFFTVVHPERPYLLLNDSQGGNLRALDTRTGRGQSVSPYPVEITGAPASFQDYRFDWGAPIALSPHDASTVYFGGNVLFKTANFGASWETISPDLTTNDPEKQKSSGGPILEDNTTAEYHCVILDISESPVEPGLIWVGTDDGQVQLTRNGGKDWTNLTDNVRGLLPDSVISHIEPSVRNAATAYMTADRHQLDDPRPYVFKTEDTGASWTNITANLPSDAYVHVLREDPKNPRVLYAGTEIGLFVSFDGGGAWQPLRMENLPTVPVYDILVHPTENDLVLGTHGRGVWVLDDARFLQEITPEILESDLHLFPPRKAFRFTPWAARGSADRGGDQKFWGPNPDYGAPLTYWSKEKDDSQPLTLQILDANDRVIRALEFEVEEQHGLHRITWDLREEGPERRSLEEEGDDEEDSRVSGPQVLPGEYVVRLGRGDTVRSSPIEVALDSALDVSRADLEAQFDAASRLVELISSVNVALKRLDFVEDQLQSLKKNLRLAQRETPESVGAPLDELLETLRSVKESLVREGEAAYGSPTRLLGKLRSMYSDIEGAHAAPTPHQREYLNRFTNERDEVMARVEAIFGQELPALNRTLRENGLPTVMEPS